MNFWTFLFSLLAFDRIREIFRSSQTQSPPALLFMPRRWCANCSDRVFLGPDMA